MNLGWGLQVLNVPVSYAAGSGWHLHQEERLLGVVTFCFEALHRWRSHIVVLPQTPSFLSSHPVATVPKTCNSSFLFLAYSLFPQLDSEHFKAGLLSTNHSGEV